jgi:hypothetical protein
MTIEELNALYAVDDTGDYTQGVAALKEAAEIALPRAIALIEQMAEALGFYSNADNWRGSGDPDIWTNIEADGGVSASITLTAYEAFKKNVNGD